MGLLYEAVMKRNFIITQLEKANISDYQNKSIYQLDYQTLKYVLTMHRIQNS
ncbi:hypothetical protein [Heyndrickxia sporothermodurans]|uniref:hypothetical protein n=1 Tax=Heyndrickxia sporothermodurans TaxID=46224 RepID=UPI0035DE96D3